MDRRALFEAALERRQELKRHDATLSADERDKAVDDFIMLVVAVDGILQSQARADADYFASSRGRGLASGEAAQVGRHFLKAYRWQYIFSGAGHPRFQRTLRSLVTEQQIQRIEAALGTLV